MDSSIPLPTKDELDRLMTSATPKPRAGEQADERIAELEEVKRAHIRDIHSLWAERDLLRERERELVEALKAVVEWVVLNKPRTYPSGDWGAYPPDCIEQASAALAKAST